MTTPHDHCGAGPAIILLHGFPFNRSMWRAQIDFLSANGYRVVAPDLRGLGENVAQTSVCDNSTEDHRLKSVPLTTMDDMAREVAALMDELKIDSAVNCGLSMGCYDSLHFLRRFDPKARSIR
jgi:pimeloyl-ACP methyl ester carboxylesterase